MSHPAISIDSLTHVTSYDPVRYKKLRRKVVLRFFVGLIALADFVVLLAMVTPRVNDVTNTLLQMSMYMGVVIVMLFLVVLFLRANREFQAAKRDKFDVQSNYRFFRNLTMSTVIEQPERASFTLAVEVLDRDAIHRTQTMGVTLMPHSSQHEPQTFIVSDKYFGTQFGEDLRDLSVSLQEMFGKPDVFLEHNDKVSASFKTALTTDHADLVR